MPYATRKTKSGKTRVVNKETGRVLAKGTSKQKAEAQVRLVEGIKHNPEFAKKVRRRVMGK
jgi:hypothetical protein